MTTWIERFERDSHLSGDRIRVAVKDAIDMAGVVTSAGCVAVRNIAVPAEQDADCVASIRAAGAHIVGKTTLTDLCLSPAGINDNFGTPVNPLAPDRIPGGSSSGSAVAVADGEADVGLGTDTGGSVRIPAACCGIVGLKTTSGRVSKAGVWPLAPTLDTVGPLAKDMRGIVTGMRLLEPGFAAAERGATVVGRLRIETAEFDAANPDIARSDVEDAVDLALARAGLIVREISLRGWEASFDAFDTIILGEFWRAHASLLDADGMTAFANKGLRKGSEITDDLLTGAMSAQRAWQDEIAAAFEDVELLALPTLVAQPPRLSDVRGFPLTGLTAPFNLAGVPALSMPVPSGGNDVLYSLQLVGPAGGEELLCATGIAVEAAMVNTPYR